MKTYQVKAIPVYNVEADEVLGENHKFDESEVLPFRLEAWLSVGLVVLVGDDGAPAKSKPAPKSKDEKPANDEDQDGDVEDRSKLSADELKKIAKALGVEKYSRMNKEKLIAAIEAAEAALESDDQSPQTMYDALAALDRAELEENAKEYEVKDFSDMSDEDLVDAIWVAAGYDPIEVEA